MDLLDHFEFEILQGGYLTEQFSTDHGGSYVVLILTYSDLLKPTEKDNLYKVWGS